MREFKIGESLTFRSDLTREKLEKIYSDFFSGTVDYNYINEIIGLEGSKFEVKEIEERKGKLVYGFIGVRHIYPYPCFKECVSQRIILFEDD
jgi:hypothetical protein